jgi:preprotein translocase subunit SecA
MDVGKIIGKFVGNKADRDMREVTPYVEKIRKVYDGLDSLGNDELRSRSKDLKQKVADHVSAERARLAELRERAEDPEVDVTEKEDIYQEIDKLEDLIDDKYEEVLNEILPEAFALIKETARRFKENEEIEVRALEYDRSLAATRESITIKGDKAIWQEPLDGRRERDCLGHGPL